MAKKRKARKMPKLSAPKKKIILSNPQLLCNKEVVIQLERLNDSVVAEMTAHSSIFDPKQTNRKKEDLGEKITRVEQSLADKGAQLNSNHALKEEEIEEMRKLKPELQNMRSHLQHEKEQLIMEKAQLEQLLKEKEQLINKNADFEKRLASAEEKLDDISNGVNKFDNTTLNINSLPEEVMLKLFSYFKLKKLCKIARVCKRWSLLAKSPVVRKKIDVSLYKIPVSPKCIVNSLADCVTQMRVESYGYWNEGWNFKEFCVSLSEKCPNLTTLIFSISDFSDSLPLVVALCAQSFHCLKTLIFDASNFPYETETSESCSTTKIENLSIFGCDLRNYYRHPFSKIQIKQLSLAYSDINKSWFQGNASFLNTLNLLDLNITFSGSSVFEAIKNEAHNLKELYLCGSSLEDADFNLNSAVFPYLEKICLKKTIVTCKTVISLLNSCRFLKIVYVDEDVAQSCFENPYFVANKCKREIVKVIDCLSEQKHRYGEDDI